MSSVLRFPPASPSQSVAYLQAKLAYYTDAWDLAEDLSRQVQGIVVVDARQAEAYRGGHICGAISFPHREMNEASTARLDRNKVYVTYCDGIGCNGSTKAAHQLALLSFQVKELTGGLHFWKRDGHPMAWGDEAGEWPQTTAAASCGC